MSQLKGCWKKRPITTEAKAKRQAKDQSMRTKEDIQAYKCLYCKFWHTGHPGKPKQPKGATYEANR